MTNHTVTNDEIISTISEISNKVLTLITNIDIIWNKQNNDRCISYCNVNITIPENDSNILNEITNEFNKKFHHKKYTAYHGEYIFLNINKK